METKPRILKWSLIIGIIVVLNLFFNYSISLFYKEPDYNAYFVQPQVVEPVTNKEECLKVGGQWYAGDNSYNQNGNPFPVLVNGKTSPVMPLGSCDVNFTKQKEFNQAQKVYNRNVFLILVVFGIVSLLAGVFIVNEVASFGLSWGGVLSLIIASMRYWSDADNWMKVFILAVALTVLFWVAIKKFGKEIK